MNRVKRNEILDLGAYEALRPQFYARIIELKKRRRTPVGEHMTLVWENRDTVLFQIQEMLRTERITNERAITHEIDTYNDLVPAPGSLSATLLIEYDEPVERSTMLLALAGLEKDFALTIGAVRVPAKFQKQPGELDTRLPAVNYVTFAVPKDAAQVWIGAEAEVAVSVTHPQYQVRVVIPEATRRELADDLAS